MYVRAHTCVCGEIVYFSESENIFSSYIYVRVCVCVCVCVCVLPNLSVTGRM